MGLEEQIANLLRIGTLKQAARDEALIRQYLTNAEQLRGDAEAPPFPSAAGEGHRSVALQLSIRELTKSAKVGGAVEAMIQIHNARNNTTYYQPLPPVSDKLADATLKLLDAALAGAKAQIHISGTPPASGQSS